MIGQDPTSPPAPPHGSDVPTSKGGAPPVAGPGPAAPRPLTPIAPPEPRIHTVMLQGGEGGPFVDCSPRTLTVRAGDAVRWKNDDHLMMPHSLATWGDACPETFRTGPIEAGEVSTPVRFRLPGVYHYRCTIHASTSPVAVIEVLPLDHPGVETRPAEAQPR